MSSLFLALALATTGDTGDTGTVPTTTGSDTSAQADTGTDDTSSATDTAGAGDTATADPQWVTAAGLAGETGGLGCQSAGRGPVRLLLLIGLTAVLRRRNQRFTSRCPRRGPAGHR